MGFSSVVTASLAAVVALLPAYVAADKPYLTDHNAFQEGNWGDAPTQKFHSSTLNAGWYQINHFDPDKVDQSSPYMFMAGKYGKWGPSIISSKDFSLIWADQHYNGLAQTARSWDNFRGQRVLSVFSDNAVRIYSQSYELLYSVTPKGELDGAHPDSHEAMLTDDGTVLMITCPTREVDLTSVGGPATGKRVANCMVQEVDPVTNEVLFQFSTLDHFGPKDASWFYNGEEVWDFCHMNSVQKTPEGNFLISYRHLSQVIMVDGQTADVLWVMWGKNNQFTDITPNNGSAHFHWQHEPRITGKNRFTLFDNHQLHNGYCEEGECSRGLEVEYDPDSLTVWMVNEWYHPQAVISGSRGGVQRLPGGNTIVAWGQNPMITEYTPEGELVMDIQRGQVLKMEHGIFDVITYRVWKGDWEGNPQQPPAIAAADSADGTSVYVSWNGATKVDHYALLMSDSMDTLDGADKVVAVSPRNGFETEFKLWELQPWARVACMDVSGNIIGFTGAVNVTSGEKHELDYEVTKVTEKKVPWLASLVVPTGMAAPFFTGTGVGKVVHSAFAMSAFAFVFACASIAAGLIVYRRRRAAGLVSYGRLNTEGDNNDEEFSDKDRDGNKRT